MISSCETFTLAILETGDLHGNLLPINYGINQPSEVGLAKIASLIRQQRQVHSHTLLIDNGDLIQGTPLSYYHARIDNSPIDPMIKVLNALGYDMAVLGNHEFNYGLDVLNKAIGESEFPWISANIKKRGMDEPFFGRPYLIKSFPGGPKVGVVGLTTHYIPNWENPNYIQGIEFQDALEAAKKWVALLKQEEKVDLVVVSYHGGFERDLDTGEPTEPLTSENQGYQLCLEVPGIDVLLTGHQHRSIAGQTVHGVVVVQPGSQGRNLGKVTVTFEKKAGKWTVIEKRSELLPVKGITPDAEVLQMVDAYEQKTQVWLDQPIGKINGDMVVKDPMKVRTKDNALIEFFNKVQMHYANVQISNTALFDNQSPGLKPDVTMRDIVANYIYPNTLKVIRLKGSDIKAALEQTATYFAQYDGQEIRVNPQFSTPKPQHYNYDMWEGIEYRLNISRPAGERVVMLNYGGQPLDMEKEYDVVMNNYRAGGGGNYFMFQNKPVVGDVPTDVSELIANYILERGTIEATVNGNWEVVHD